MRTCTEWYCSRKEAKTSTATYYFPRWWFAERVLRLLADNALAPSGKTLPPPARMVPRTARIFRHCLHGERDTLRALSERGLGSPTDTDAYSGLTPLHVSLQMLSYEADTDLPASTRVVVWTKGLSSTYSARVQIGIRKHSMACRSSMCMKSFASND